MNKVVNFSDSIVASLTRETYMIRARCISICSSIRNTKDNTLINRLKKELSMLEIRRFELLRNAHSLKLTKAIDPLSIDFLIEICKRPIN